MHALVPENMFVRAWVSVCLDLCMYVECRGVRGPVLFVCRSVVACGFLRVSMCIFI